MESESAPKNIQNEIIKKPAGEKTPNVQSPDSPAAEPRDRTKPPVDWKTRMRKHFAAAALPFLVALPLADKLPAQTPEDSPAPPAQEETIHQSKKIETITPQSLKNILKWFHEGGKGARPAINVSSDPSRLPENLIAEIPQYREQFPQDFLNIAKYLKSIPNLAEQISKANETSQWMFLKNIQEFKDISGLDLKEEVIKARERNPLAFFDYIQNTKDILGTNLIEQINKGAEQNPDGFLDNVNKLLDLQDLNVTELIVKASEHVPFGVLKIASEVDLDKLPIPNIKEKIILASERNPAAILFKAPYVKNIPELDLPELISKATQRRPGLYLKLATNLKEVLPQSTWSTLTEKAFELYPEEINRDSKILLTQIENPQLESTRILKTINHPETAILLNELAQHGLSEENALKIVNDNDKLFKTLVKIKSEPNHLGSVSVEETLKELSLKMVLRVNELHERPDSVRFTSINNLSSKELYTLMVYGEEEIFTSTFNGMFNRLLDKMTHVEKIDGQQLLDQVGHNKFRTFIKEAAGFNRLNEFLDLMKNDDANRLLSDVVTGLDQTTEKLARAVTVADIFSMISNPEQLKILQEQIKKEYDRVTSLPVVNKQDQVIYSILSGMFGEKAVVNGAWLKEMSEKFKLPDITRVKSEELFNNDNTNIQRHFFFDDRADKIWDGHLSFQSMLNAYGAKVSWDKDGNIFPIKTIKGKEWQIEDKGSYVLVTSVGKQKKIEIYANKPTQQEESEQEIENVFKQKGLEPTLLVHRGHSYHAQQTIEKIPTKAKIISLGSCGGYNNVEQVSRKAPNAHPPLSTKATGTMLVNDPLLIMLNRQILSGQDIVWPEFWKKAEEALGKNKNFQYYVPPHKNLGAIYLKAYQKEMEKE